MRLGWCIPLPGPFFLSGTVLRSRRRRSRRQVWHGTLPGWRCEHAHRTQQAAVECAQRQSRRRLVTP